MLFSPYKHIGTDREVYQALVLRNDSSCDFLRRRVADLPVRATPIYIYAHQDNFHESTKRANAILCEFQNEQNEALPEVRIEQCI